MKILFDTSVLVAGMVLSHSKHESCFAWLSQAKKHEFEFILSAHSLAELYSVLTSLPMKPKISPSIGLRLIEENIKHYAKVVALEDKDYFEILQTLSNAEMVGGIVFDALISKVGEKEQVDKLLTLNEKHFRRVWRGNPEVIVVP